MEIDVLADILEVGQLGSKVICQPTLPPPWGLDFDVEKRAMCHIVTRGTCWFIPFPGADPIKLIQGDLAFLPECRGHRLLSSLDSKVAHYQKEITRKKNEVASGKVSLANATALFCSHYILEGDIALPFFSLLPPFIHLSADTICGEPNLQKLINMIMSEESSTGLGRKVILSKLIDLLLIYIIRISIKNEKNQKASWMHALTDPKIGTSISLMHKSPSKKWTVDSLAKELSMSRSSFAKRFTEFTGASPLSYLTIWRMDLSAKLLRDSKMSVGEVARHVGYDSEPSFSKVFKRYRKVPPGEYRSAYKNDLEGVTL